MAIRISSVAFHSIPWILAMGTVLSAGGFFVPVVARPESEVLLVQVRLRNWILAESLAVYPTTRGTLIPLGELCSILELGIHVDARMGLAEGFFLRQGNTFRLDLVQGGLYIHGKEFPFPVFGVEIHAGDIYVDTDLLALWFSIGMRVDEAGAVLLIEPHEKLPIQERLERENRLIRRPEDAAQRFRNFERIDLPYQAFSVPWVDLGFTSQIAQNPGPGQRHVRPTLQAALGGDLLWMSAQANLTIQSNAQRQQQRLTLARRDPEGGLLGPLDAREILIGDVYAPGMGLASASSIGAGFLLSSYPLESLNTPDTRSFVGELPSGWQVELYLNGGLIGFQTSRADGRYQFMDIPLAFGTNDFRLVFYGPNGERRVERQRVDLKELKPNEGELRYQISYVNPLFALPRYGFQGEYGLSKRFVAQASVLSLSLRGLDKTSSVKDQREYHHTYFQSGLRGYWDRAIGRLLVSVDGRNGGRAEQLAVDLGYAEGHTLSVNHTQLQDFVSEVYLPHYGAIRDRSLLALTGALWNPSRPWGNYSLALQRDDLVQGGTYDRMGVRLSVSARGFMFGNGLDFTKLRDYPNQGQGSSQANGAFMVSRNFREWGLRGQANYVLNGGRRHLTDISLYGDTRSFRNIQLQVGIARSVDAHTLSYMANAYKSTGRFSLGVNVSYSPTSKFSGTLSLHVGLSRDPSGRWRSRAESVSGYGGTYARAFEDRNGNGLRDPEEAWIENTALAVNGSAGPSTGGSTPFNDRLPADRYAYVNLVEGSLEDPLARPSKPGYKLLPRAGRIATLEVPVMLFGQINGTVFVEEKGALKPLPSIQVELLDADGKIIKAERAAYDGIFSIDGVKPGRYRLRLAPAELEMLGLLGPDPREITIDPTGTILDDVSLTAVAK